MKVEISARVDEQMLDETAAELALLRELPEIAKTDIEIATPSVKPFRFIEDDGEGGIEIAMLAIQIATGVFTALSIKGILALVQASIDRVLNRIRRADKVELTLITPTESYNLFRT